MDNNQKIPMKNYLTLLILVVSAAAFYQIPYLRWTFYDGMMELSGLNNTQFGLTMSVYGTVSMILYLPGGIIADKISSRILVPVSLIVTGAAGLILMTGPGFGVQMVSYILLAAAGTLTFWAALNKAVRNLDGGDGSRMFGLLEGGRGLAQAAFSAIFLAVFGMCASAVGGVKAVLGGYAALNILFGVLSFLVLEDDSKAGASAEPLRGADIFEILKMPAIWLLTLVVISSYCFHLASTYLTPYFTNVIGATAVLSGALAVVRTYIAQMAGAPFGSARAQKTGSSAFTVACGFIAMAVGIGVVAVLPSDSGMMVPLVIFMIISAVSIYVIRGIYFAIIGECGIPLRLTGTAIGIVSVIGFTPDIFVSPVCGALLDRYEGAQGYRYIFIMMLAVAVIGLISAWSLYFMSKKKKEGDLSGQREASHSLSVCRADIFLDSRHLLF